MFLTGKHSVTQGVKAEAFPDGPVDAQMIGVMKCILAYFGLATIWLDPTEPTRLGALTCVFIAMRSESQKLLVEIANESLFGVASEMNFIPRSINGRAHSLGGLSGVKRDARSYTVVHLSIPLRFDD